MNHTVVTYFLPIPGTERCIKARSELLNVSLASSRVKFYTTLSVFHDQKFVVTNYRDTPFRWAIRRLNFMLSRESYFKILISSYGYHTELPCLATEGDR